MNKDQVSGKVEQAIGKGKRVVGETVGSEKLANQGIAEQVKGAVTETVGDAKDAAKKIEDSHAHQAAEGADQKRARISHAVDQAKEKVKDKIEDFKQRHSA